MDAVSTTQSSTAGSGFTTPVTNTGATLSSDFETFLKMLTTQMENQDPLNPVDSSDYAVQLATFSSVEQQVMTNDLLAGLASQLGAMGTTQLAGWIGMEARTAMPAHFDGGTSIQLTPYPARLADQATLVVHNADGFEVERTDISLTGENMEWAGIDENGYPLPAGLYSFTLESRSDGELLDTTIVETYAQVIEARVVGGQTELILPGNIRVVSEDVSALRNAN